jgi:hypothetical protein
MVDTDGVGRGKFNYQKIAMVTAGSILQRSYLLWTYIVSTDIDCSPYKSA